MTALTRFTSIWIGTMVLLLAVPAAEARPPRGHAAWNKRGQRDWKRDRIAAANQAFQTAIDLHYREQYLWNLGRSFEELGHPQRALAIYQWLSANSGDLGDRYLRKLPEARARASAAVGAPTSTDHPSVPILPSFECPRGMEPVPAGPYWRGSDTPRPDALSPVHLVYVSAFCIDRHEVSVSAYSRCVAAEKCRAGTYAAQPAFTAALRPMVGVSWSDATDFCSFAGRRLPTEAQWGKVARGIRRRSAPGESLRANLQGAADGFPQTAPVGSIPADRSLFGAYDLLGNAAEWVADVFQVQWVPGASPRDPTGPTTGNLRVVRGASWNTPPRRAWVETRRAVSPDNRAQQNVSFRCASSPIKSVPKGASR